MFVTYRDGSLVCCECDSVFVVHDIDFIEKKQKLKGDQAHQ